MITEPCTVGTPTRRWLASAQLLPVLDDPAADTAERLLLLLHYGVDWDSWVGARRENYWASVLPDRVIVATYRSSTLRSWWCQVSASLEARPRNSAEARELEELLRQPDGPVLRVLREETEALLLRTRIVAQEVRTARALQPEGEVRR